MTAKTLELECGSRSSGPTGFLPSDHSLLDISGSAVSRRFDRLFAVINGGKSESSRVRLAIQRACGPGGLADSVERGTEECFVRQMVEQVLTRAEPARPASRNRKRKPHIVGPADEVAVAIALLCGEDVVLVSYGGGRADICKANGVLAAPAGVGDTNSMGASIWRTSLSVGDSVILTGRQVADRVSQADLRHTVQASVSPSRAAEWLVTLAKGQGETVSTALVAQVSNVQSPSSVVIPQKMSRLGSYLPTPRLRTIGLGSVVAAALMAGASLGPAIISGSSDAVQLQSTNRLTVADAKRNSATLRWADPSGVATGYRVSLDGNNYVTSKQRLYVTGLQPGRTYVWAVTSLFGDQMSHHFSSAILRTAGMRKPAPVRVLSPVFRSRLPAQKASSVAFCWAASPAERLFAFFMSGSGERVHQTVSRSTSGHAGRICLHRSLPMGAWYSWRVGVGRNGQAQSWTGWQHFFVVGQTKARRQMEKGIPALGHTVHTPPQQTTPATSTSVTSTSANSTSSTGGYYDPSYGSSGYVSSGYTGSGYAGSGYTNSAPASSPEVVVGGGSVTTTAPAPPPTSPVEACSTPPNC